MSFLRWLITEEYPGNWQKPPGQVIVRRIQFLTAPSRQLVEEWMQGFASPDCLVTISCVGTSEIKGLRWLDTPGSPPIYLPKLPAINEIRSHE